MTGFYKSFCPFFSKSLPIRFNLQKMFLLSFCLMVWWWLQMKVWLLVNVSKKEMQGNIRSNIAFFVHIWNISNIACHKKSLKFILFFISKFKFDLVHCKKLKGTLMQIWKFRYMFGFIQNQYPENFTFLILRILELLTREVCLFLKK